MKFTAPPQIISFCEYEEHAQINCVTYVINGTCRCGYGANMRWMTTYASGLTEPICHRCVRNNSVQTPLSKEAYDYFMVKWILEQ